MDIVSKIAGCAASIINPLTELVKPHFGYLFCYEKKIQKLKSEIEKIKDQKTRIQGRVDRAKDDGEIIEDDVTKWLTEVQNMEDEVDKFLEDKVNENKQCLKCWCPDLTWRYRLGKGAEKKRATVMSLKDEGRNFEMVPVASPAPFPKELQLPSSGDYMNFNSRASVLNGIMEALKDSEVNLIGVHGPGGAGKTTLAEKAAKQAKEGRLFDEIVMAVVSKDANVRKIQEELASKLNLTYKEDNEVGRRGQLWNRLKEGNKKILVIMDDVWQQLNMKEIGIPIADGGRGCKVLLTTRREGVCQKMEVQKDFPIGVLEEQEAWSLFKKAVGNFVVPQSVAEVVCKECGGLPVAIVAVGAALKGKQGHVWDDALNQLKNSSVEEIPDIDPKMYTSLKWSYDYLEHEDAKSCFLLCCLFPEDANIPIEDLVRYCIALRLLRHTETVEKARCRVEAMVDLLKSSCLLLHGENENYVKMHDVIRDVAISITNGKQERQRQQWPNKQQFLVKHDVQKWPEDGTWEHYTAVSMMANDIFELPGDLQCPELHYLLLQCPRRYLVDAPVLPDPFFNGMTKLTVLCLAGFVLPLPPSFTNLVNLRMLQTSDCGFKDIGIIKNLKNNLEIIILGAFSIEELPLEIGELTRLRLLDLRQCRSLKVIPQGVISKLIRMEELYISEVFNQWEGSTTSNRGKSNVSLRELKSLKQLTTLYIHIPDVTLVPNDLRFENLIRFQISVGETFGFLGRHSSRMLKLDSSRILKLVGFRLKTEFNVLINRAEVLYFRKVEGLETLFHETHHRGFSNLKHLEIIDCHDLEYLLGKPEWLSTKLTEVVIENCRRLKYLCSSSCAKELLQLQQLHIRNCEIMEAIVETEMERDEEQPENMMIDFSQLREMELKWLPKLIGFFFETKRTTKENPCIAEQSLFNEKVVFPALKKLEIESLPNTDIWDKQLLVAKSFCQLEVLMVNHCNKVVNVIPSNMFCQLKNLETLTIHYCNSVKFLVEQPNTEEVSETTAVKVELPCLRNVNLVHLPNLISTGLEEKEYCSHRILVCTSLTTLNINQCDSIRNVFSSSILGKLEHLERLHVESCQNMDTIISNEGKEGEGCVITFPQLSSLRLYALPNLKSFCSSKFEVQVLFNYQVVFPKLKNFFAAVLASVRKINLWNVIANVDESLEAVNLWGFDQITMLSSHHSMQRFISLRKLILSNCLGVTQPFDVNGPNVEEGQVEPCIEVKILQLDGLTWLTTCFWKKNPFAVLALRNLKFLTISSCSFLRNLFTHSVASSLEQLLVVSVKSCKLMEEVVTNKGEEQAIEVNIEFPKLSLLLLYNLPNLESFCSANYNFKFPSLKFVMLRWCPKMRTFTSGKAKMPQTKIVTNWEKKEVTAFQIGDLNKYLKREEIATIIGGFSSYAVLRECEFNDDCLRWEVQHHIFPPNPWWWVDEY